MMSASVFESTMVIANLASASVCVLAFRHYAGFTGACFAATSDRFGFRAPYLVMAMTQSQSVRNFMENRIAHFLGTI
jgi:hypothetical protein